ncbi:MAG TPA: maleylpyruvate isomerase N-terminal domain-containing protein [Actinophytocola sp.]|uniref:maleylpyruvate isomerase N-terminal domain-containing protein n=1 Tax=Actinophytocola sp. TaxID=1872138 RepID=UPI002DDD8B61|nr:maleylpyruvate isomerase N-terminal domain-containing protein [Actinophytocola sp.]HEV2783922.1 maleylpyruvate isomerase N-terminal domain-containing protein [Actinophytocola sp.]
MDWLEVFGEQAAKFRAAVGRAELGAAVPSCPHWTFTDLVVHVGRFLDQVTRYLTSGSMTRLPPRPADEVTDPLAYLDDRLGPAAAALSGTPANRPVWTFSPAAPALAWVWRRRAAHELNLRRWDAQAALRALEPTDREQAVDAIDEQLGTLLAAQLAVDSPPEVKGTAVVSCTDGPESWFVALTPGEAPLVRPAADGEEADATLRGTATNLVYQLRGRMRLTGSGDPEVLRGIRLP